MDSRKIQFLINIQKDIDKLEKDKIDNKRLENLKSKFYDLADVEDIAQDKYKKIEFAVDELIKYEPKNRIKDLVEQKLPEFLEKNKSNLNDKHIEASININKKDYLFKTLGELRLFYEILIKKAKSKKTNITFHKPKETKTFLSLFNNSDGLKYLTHNFATDKPKYEKFISLCKNEFEQAKTDYPNTPNNLLNRINEFAFAQNPKWFIREGKEKKYPNLGWAKPEFIEWYNKKTSVHPWENEKWKNEMLIPFKETIEIREGNLKKHIDNAINFAFGKFKETFIFEINDDNLIKADKIYTDVDRVNYAIYHIFNKIKDVSEKNFYFKVSIEYSNETLEGGESKKIIITHIDSESNKASNDPEFLGGDLKTIQKLLWGLCNYEIEAKFIDGYKKRIILTDNHSDYKKYIKENETISLKEEDVKGFTHILKFY